ncbi:MAG: M15 family metallopeptidase [Firmicutes bacterium]|nr:M15 family metallopeptidase [Bacillota bacterium]
MKRMCTILLVLAICLAGCAVSSPGVEETAAQTSAPTTSAPTETQAATVPTTQATESAETVETQAPEPADSDFVRVQDYLPEITVELRYATENNFTGQIIYEFTDAWLRYGTVKKLMDVQAELAKSGLSLKIWDAFRPTQAQYKLWEVFPDPTYVANPINGFSSHSRGNTVDVTLVDSTGAELTMPTGFDDFTALADRDYSDCPPDAAANAQFLEQVMKECGFIPYSGEWWHFSDEDSYPVEEDFYPPS